MMPTRVGGSPDLPTKAHPASLPTGGTRTTGLCVCGGVCVGVMEGLLTTGPRCLRSSQSLSQRSDSSCTSGLRSSGLPSARGAGPAGTSPASLCCRNSLRGHANWLGQLGAAVATTYVAPAAAPARKRDVTPDMRTGSKVEPFSMPKKDRMPRPSPPCSLPSTRNSTAS